MKLKNVIIQMNLSGRIEEALLKIISDFAESSVIGEVKLMAGANAPSDNYLPCDGQALNKADYQDLYNLIGSTYGETATTFNLPDLRDRVPVGASGTKALGSAGGAETVTLLEANLPAHTHGSGSITTTVGVNNESPDTQDANGAVLGQTNSDDVVYTTSGATAALGGVSTTGTTAPTGSGTAVNNMQPYTAMNYFIKVK